MTAYAARPQISFHPFGRVPANGHAGIRPAAKNSMICNFILVALGGGHLVKLGPRGSRSAQQGDECTTYRAYVEWDELPGRAILQVVLSSSLEDVAENDFPRANQPVLKGRSWNRSLDTRERKQLGYIFLSTLPLLPRI